MPSKPPIDWEAVEREYRAGQLSVAEIGRQFAVSRAAIMKRAAKFGWVRNLADEVRREVESKLVADAVSGGVTSCNARETIDAAASRGVEVVRQHRRTLSRLNGIANGLMTAMESRLEAVRTGVTDTPELVASFALLGEKETIADAMEKVSRTIAKVVPLERQAFGLDKAQDASPASDPRTKAERDAAIRAALGEE